MSDQISKITWAEIVNDILQLSRQIQKPDAIVTIGRGGNIPGTMLGYKLDTKTIINFGIQSYDDNKQSLDIKLQQLPDVNFLKKFKGKRILVVDDLADKGATLEYVKDYFRKNDIDPEFCTLYIKSGTKFTPHYFVKAFKSDEWIEFPWDDLSSF